MKEYNPQETISDYSEERQELIPETRVIIKHILLFIITFASVAMMGTLFVSPLDGSETRWDLFYAVATDGALFAALLLGFLAVHEFGHYFAALYHRVHTSLPYFIPLPFISPIGTIGAVIRIRERINETRKLFDIGVSGPVAGFILSLFILLYGFFTLPGPEYMLDFPGHSELHNYIAEHGTYPEEPLDAQEDAMLMVMGETLLYSFIASFFDNAPPMWEMYHFPFLFAGWLGLFFTALNLMPVGQLDGGHILYSLIGYKKHRTYARIFYTLVIGLGGIGVLPLLHELMADYDTSYALVSWSAWAFISYMMLRKAFHKNPTWTVTAWIVALFITAISLYGFVDPRATSGYGIWAFWSLFILFLVRIEHPPVVFERPLSPRRRALGWANMVIFVLCISPNPIYFI